MKRRSLYLLAACLLLSAALCGCGFRSAVAREPSAPAPEATPAPTPEPTPAPPPTATPEPTPCPHLTWTDGVCDGCGEVCTHPGWKNGCCMVCGMACSHPSHNSESRNCDWCGQTVPHTYLNGVCTMCGEKPAFINEILPRNLFTPCRHKGTVEELHYTTWDYVLSLSNPEPIRLEKKLYVYLPYGYDPAERYDMLILLHGMGEKDTYWLVDRQDYLYPQEDFVYTTDLLDNLMEMGWCHKMIIATPTFYRYPDNMGVYNQKLDERQFLQELREDILPLLLAKYPTYAREATLEAMGEAREHFGYAGLSMGSIYAYTTIMPECLDLFGWYGCFSGSDGNMTQLAAVLNAPENADKPICYFYNSIGTNDGMFNGHNYQYHDLVKRSDGLTDGVNACFNEIRGAKHLFTAWATGLYNFLPVLFSLPAEQ
ncbi:MAG: hypothetical protein IKQ10_05995 [Oscillospiraceae bacterium]|nr:hypothetical protein [Oscillospiraceae bacterium]